jgi:hypothetical protein
MYDVSQYHPKQLVIHSLDAITEVRDLLKIGDVSKASIKLAVLESSLYTGLALEEIQSAESELEKEKAKER